jgi:hypothetical protein
MVTERKPVDFATTLQALCVGALIQTGFLNFSIAFLHMVVLPEPAGPERVKNNSGPRYQLSIACKAFI